jgi:hypothetical protein
MLSRIEIQAAKVISLFHNIADRNLAAAQFLSAVAIEHPADKSAFLAIANAILEAPSNDNLPNEKCKYYDIFQNHN